MEMSVAKADTASRVRESSFVSATRTFEDEWLKPSISRNDFDVDQTLQPAATDVNKVSDTARPISRSMPAPVLRKAPPVLVSKRKVQLLQQWECIIHSVNDKTIECEMHDLTDESRPVELAEIYIDEFHEFDRRLLTEGAVFYWSIGRETSALGQVRKYSELRVRRMPELSTQRKKEIARRAQNLDKILNGQRD
jgi:hypothetical protein